MRRRDLLFGTLVSPILGGCGRDLSTLDGVLRFGLANPPRNLDPRLATDATSERVNRLLYGRLVDLDDQGLPVPGIACWELLTPTHYRFELGGA
ncbi:MAG: ABC transporter substrate-binding protein, partial [Bdellovibrio bacteriovorus]